MRRNRKILDEARASVADVVAPEPPPRPRWRGRNVVVVGVSLHLRRNMLKQMVPQYQEASSAHKQAIVEDFVRLTGYHRKYAMWLFNHTKP